LSQFSRTSEQQELYELLIVLVEKFEQEFYQTEQKNNPISMLLFLMKQRDMQSALVDVFGSKSVVEDVIAERVQIDRSISESLGQLFHVDSMLFI
jgi:HTH-type transcriptional regulator / antitoxin HigA